MIITLQIPVNPLQSQVFQVWPPAPPAVDYSYGTPVEAATAHEQSKITSGNFPLHMGATDEYQRTSFQAVEEIPYW